MARDADFESTGRAHHDDDAWFDDHSSPGASVGGHRRDRRARVVLAVVLALLLVAGIALGAFSGGQHDDGAQQAAELERLRARARAAASPSPLRSGGDDALFDGLDRLVAALPPPAPVADVVAADAADATGDGVAEADTGPAAPEVKEAKVEPPKPKDPKVGDAKDPKIDPKLGFPLLDPKPADTKVEPKPADDPKLKGPVEAALAEAKAHLDAGRWAEARAGYDKALGLSPGNPKALLGRGRALLELRQVQPALKDIMAVLSIDARNPTALLLAGSISQEVGQKDAARGFYQRYLDAWPSGRKAAEVKALLERL